MQSPVVTALTELNGLSDEQDQVSIVSLKGAVLNYKVVGIYEVDDFIYQHQHHKQRHLEKI